MNKSTAKLRQIRKDLEAYHSSNKPEAIDAAWPYLDHKDEFIRHAARIALEHQTLSEWTSKLKGESSKGKVLNGAIAYARADGALNDMILDKLQNLKWNRLSAEEKISISRIYELLLIRQGKPDQISVIEL